MSFFIFIFFFSGALLASETLASVCLMYPSDSDSPLSEIKEDRLRLLTVAETTSEMRFGD